MRKQKWLFALLLTALAGAPALAAARVVPGDVLVTFRNPSPTSRVTAESLSRNSKTFEAGEHLAYAQSVAESLGARVVHVYKSLSEAGNDIMVLLHTDTQPEEELLEALRARPDVKGASLNHVQTLSRGRSRGSAR